MPSISTYAQMTSRQQHIDDAADATVSAAQRSDASDHHLHKITTSSSFLVNSAAVPLASSSTSDLCALINGTEQCLSRSASNTSSLSLESSSSSTSDYSGFRTPVPEHQQRNSKHKKRRTNSSSDNITAESILTDASQSASPQQFALLEDGVTDHINFISLLSPSTTGISSSPSPLLSPQAPQSSYQAICLSSPSLSHTDLSLAAVMAPPLPPAKPFCFDTRFQVERTLAKTIFGEMKKCVDRESGVEVVVKISDEAKMEQRFFGHSVQEDTRKEGMIMRSLGLHLNDTQLAAQHVDIQTCGLSQAFIRNNTDASTTTLTPAALSSISSGRRYISSLIGEFDTPNTHYIATEFAQQGDLYGVLTKMREQNPSAPYSLPESKARVWFQQLCQAVQYMHAQSVAHLDISVENICIDENDCIKLIDHGLAAKHPHAKATSFGYETDRIKNTVSSVHATADTYQPTVGCKCEACYSTSSQLLQREKEQIEMTKRRYPKAVEDMMMRNTESSATASESELPSPSSSSSSSSDNSFLSTSCRFLLRPICSKYCKPGKLSYMSTELCDPQELHQPFDGYKTDCFSLGVILFILLTGLPPFTKASEKTDAWWRWFASGEWMEERRYRLPVAKHYTRLSPNAWSLIDALFKPQHVRLTIDEILAHPFMNEQDPLSQPLDRLA